MRCPDTASPPLPRDNREPISATPTDDVQTADVTVDGVADILHVRVDQDLCTGDGLCVQLAPEGFEFDVDGLAYVKDAAGELMTWPGGPVPVRPRGVHEVLESAEGCPGECIFVERALSPE